MEGSVRVGTVAGIRVAANWSLLVVSWLITWAFATGGVRSEYPGYSDRAYWAAGILTALALAGALLAHELAHALVARRQGISVDGITLWLFGGVTHIRGQSAAPGGAFKVAAAGPVMSMVLAGLFASLATVLDGLEVPALLIGVAAWLARMNLILAALNLIPAAPLDGGRVLQSFLWWRRGDPLSATLSAAKAGRGFGCLVIAAGLVAFSAGTGVAGVWLLFLGWFLVTAAQLERLSAEVRGRLDGVRVADVMTSNPVVAPGWMTVESFLEEDGLRHRFSAFPVQRFDGSPYGLVTVKRLIGVPHEQRRALRVLDVASKIEEVPVTCSDAMLLDLVGEMVDSGHGRALVLDDGRLVGIVSPRDVARGLEAAGRNRAPIRTSKPHGSHFGRP